jgi:hypothetical protein
MGSGITPNQTRAVDPFASYNSDVVNRLTNMVTKGYRGLPTIYDLQVTMDSTSTDRVLVSDGWCFKDDVLIHITSGSTVKMFGEGADNNYAHSVNLSGMDNGYYYIVLYYNYVKSRPAPTARIYVIEDTGTNINDMYPDNTGDYLLLKVVEVTGAPASPVVASVLDADPTGGRTDNIREYLPSIIGPVDSEPTFDTTMHTGRIIFDIDTDTMKYGAAADWKTVGTGTTNKVTENITATHDWFPSGGFYYHDINISGLGIADRFASITCKDNSTHEIVVPWRAGLTTATNCRIWMPVNTVSLGVTIIG